VKAAWTAPLLAPVLALLLVASPVHSEVWVFVDEQGVSHFASSQLDPRYTLFFKGHSSLDPVPPAEAVASPEERLKDSRIYQRVAKDPNVQRYAPLIEQNAKANALDPALVKAIIAVESAFDPAAISPKGAVGLMQVMPDTAVRYGVAGDAKRSAEQKLLAPAINVRVGTRYLRDLLQRFEQDITLALAAYNAGEAAVEQNGNRVPPYPETVEYVQQVRLFHDLYRPRPPALPTPPQAPARIKLAPRKALP